MKYVAPSIKETAFNCPHCGVLCPQYWYLLLGNEMKTGRAPFWPTSEWYEAIDYKKFEDKAEEVRVRYSKLIALKPFLNDQTDSNYSNVVHHLNMTKCYHCDDIAIWIADRIVYPETSTAPAPSVDMPADVRQYYEEASRIVGGSARGAAALLRLAIERLCSGLDVDGKNINENIKNLVKNGLDPKIQRALDVVRVVGNNAVHPGTIDFSDDSDIAQSLFSLINIIVDKMITEPKHIDELYAALPPGALAAIEKRDAADE